MHLLHKDFKEACSWLSNGSYETPTIIYNLSSINSTPSFDAQRYERFFQRPWLSPEAKQFLFEERRLDERVVRWCRLSSWRDRQGVNWLQIPYYDRDGHLVGIQNRNLQKGAQPRFRFPQGSECGIYNLPILNLLHEGEELWITEGASDCWAALSAGHKAIAIPSATLLKRKDLDQLLSFSSSLSLTFHMAPDRDEPGERLFLQLQQLLPNLTHHQLPPTCKDFSDYYLQLASRVRLAAPSAGPAHFKL
jgi:DNA primase